MNSKIHNLQQPFPIELPKLPLPSLVFPDLLRRVESLFWKYRTSKFELLLLLARCRAVDPRSMINTFRFNPARQRRRRGRHFTSPTTVAHTWTTSSPLFSCQSKSRPLARLFAARSVLALVLRMSNALNLTLPRPSSIRYYCFPCTDP